MEPNLNNSMPYEIIDVTDEIELTEDEMEYWQKQIDIAENELCNQLISFKVTSEQKNALELICKQLNISIQDYLYRIFTREIIKEYESIKSENNTSDNSSGKNVA